ncbi:oxepin-CoA hydrolase, alternative type [Arthrobacter cavernae]|uniref:Enoyl-CoA hydratase/isomerase family protein n=1 Tax=Arthrobacter cavernae TaxID=2817681 RepID=A0A939KIK7_9MICC|nr:enoyl-CoA hydratase family protein [Arthrobacter cavernae]MBO1267747.1 enoyl-CoA hydratase/isomerase family protein [Arthrobacter cavernae]
MNTEVLLARNEGAALVLTINNPATRNSIGPEFFQAAREALNAAAADPVVGAIVFTGAGGFFSSGGNLNQLAATRELTAEARRARLELLHGLIRAIRNNPKPVIMAVEGGAAGAGMSLALAGDLLVAARNAFFAAAYIKAGLTPDGGLTALLAESVPRQFLTRMCLTGERVSAERMHALGVVGTLAEPGSAEAAAIGLARQLARGPERATARILGLCRTAPALPLDEQMEREAGSMVESLGDSEAVEGIAAVLGRRNPDFDALRG